MPEFPCAERAKLERAVVDAIIALRAAKLEGRDLLAIVLKETLVLQKHIESHQCKWSKASAR